MSKRWMVQSWEAKYLCFCGEGRLFIFGDNGDSGSRGIFIALSPYIMLSFTMNLPYNTNLSLKKLSKIVMKPVCRFHVTNGPAHA
jgi:hypothetical protein